MTTKAQALAAARRKWGKDAIVRHNPNALAGEQREALRRDVAGLKDRVAAIDAELKALKYDWRKLLEAVEFWRDVDGQEPSTSGLKDAADMARRVLDLTDERRLTDEEWKDKRGYLHSYRWSAGYDLGYIGIHAQADTLDELLAKLEGL